MTSNLRDVGGVGKASTQSLMYIHLSHICSRVHIMQRHRHDPRESRRHVSNYFILRYEAYMSLGFFLLAYTLIPC
jgi:hypothetical protein